MCHNKEQWYQDALNCFSWVSMSASVDFSDCNVDLILDPTTNWPCQDPSI